MTVCVCVSGASPYLQDDIRPGQTAPLAEADLNIVKPTVPLCDVLDLHVTTALRRGLLV